MSAPNPSTSDSSARAASATTRRPSALANCTAYPPTAPAAPVTANVLPGSRDNTSSAWRAVNPFIGSVDASASETPAGERATDSAGTTTRSAYAPSAPSGTSDRHDPVAHAQVGVHTLADLLEDAGRIHAGDVGCGNVLQPVGAGAAAQAPCRWD